MTQHKSLNERLRCAQEMQRSASSLLELHRTLTSGIKKPRKEWTDAERRALVAAIDRSVAAGASLAEACRVARVPMSTLRRWRTKHGQANGCKADWVVELPYLVAVTGVINFHLDRVRNLSLAPSQGDEFEVMMVLMGLSRSIEYNVRGR